jgi:hypothetical protein
MLLRRDVAKQNPRDVNAIIAKKDVGTSQSLRLPDQPITRHGKQRESL